MTATTAYRCVIVDDEPHAVEVLKAYVCDTPGLSLVETFSHALAAANLLQRTPVDLIFLDIRMPQLLGTQFVRSLPQPPKVIFTTAYREYAVDGFELGAVDYLLKPISFDRFLKAVYKIIRPASGTDSLREAATSEKFLYFRADRKMVKVLLSEICYVESLKDYIRIITTKGQLITKQSISSMEKMLPEDEFIRIHRSFIVARSRVESFTTTDITVGKAELPIGPLYRHEVAQRIRT